MFDLLLVILVLGGFLLFCAGYGSFMNGFKEKFGRSFFHWLDILVVIMIILSMAAMSGSTAWTVAHYVSWAALAALGIWHIVKYGFFWGLGVLLYNILTIALVISVITAISDFVNKNNK